MSFRLEKVGNKTGLKASICQKRHIKLLRIKLCPVTLVIGLPGWVLSLEPNVLSFGSKDST